MSTIRCVYAQLPKFPATDQHPDAVRYVIGSFWVDAIGGQPTQAEVDLFLNPPGPTQAELQAAAVTALDQGGSTIDILKLLKAKFVSDLAFRLAVAPGALTGAQLDAERTRIANIYKAL